MTLPIQEDIHAEILFHDSIKIVAGPKNRWARQRKVELSELADEAWCLPPPESLIGSRIAEVFRARNIKFPPNGAARGGASFLCACLPRGPFLGTMPDSMLRFGANVPRLTVLPVALPIEPWPVGVMTLKNRTLAPVVKLFIDCAREVVKPLAT
jgi:DNA-binding transcriptional LysR family regulator